MKNIGTSAISVDQILSSVSQLSVRDQSKDGAQNKRTMAQQTRKSEQNRKDTQQLENMSRKLQSKLKDHNQDGGNWFTKLIGSHGRKAARITNKIKNKDADIKIKQADLEAIKERNQDELTSMKNSLESFDDVFKSLSNGMNVHMQSIQTINNGIKS